MTTSYDVTVFFPDGGHSRGKVLAIPQTGTILNWDNAFGLSTWRVANVTITGGDEPGPVRIFVESHPDYTDNRVEQEVARMKFVAPAPLKLNEYQKGWNAAVEQVGVLILDARFDKGAST